MSDLTRVRNPDYDTSIEGAIQVNDSAEDQKSRLYRAYRDAGSRGLTDEEAAEKVGLLDSCYWKRCGELRKMFLIRHNGQKRKGKAGTHRIVCTAL